MTPAELEKWNKGGCVERSILKIAELNGSKMTPDEFVERFGVEMNDQTRFSILKELGISVLSQTKDYDDVLRAINSNGKRVLVKSERDLSRGSTAPLKHCSVLTDIDSDGFKIWTPLSDGRDDELTFTRAEWIEKEFSGQILG